MKKIQGVFKSIAAVLSAPIFSATVYASRKCHNVRFHDLSVRLLLCKVIYPKYSGSFNFYPSSTNNILYKSLHLPLKFETSVRLLRLIVWPQEVSEVTEVKVRKILDENPKIANF